MPPTCDPVPYEFVVVSFIFGVKEEGGRRGTSETKVMVELRWCGR
jgi:hypothetical protein